MLYCSLRLVHKMMGKLKWLGKIHHLNAFTIYFHSFGINVNACLNSILISQIIYYSHCYLITCHQGDLKFIKLFHRDDLQCELALSVARDFKLIFIFFLSIISNQRRSKINRFNNSNISMWFFFKYRIEIN